MESHEHDAVDGIRRDVLAEIRAVLDAAGPVIAPRSSSDGSASVDAAEVTRHAWFAAANANRRLDGENPADPGGASGWPSTRDAAVTAQEKALRAAMVAHAVAEGAESAAHSAEAAASSAEAEARRAEALLAAVAASFRFAGTLGGDETEPPVG